MRILRRLLVTLRLTDVKLGDKVTVLPNSREYSNSLAKELTVTKVGTVFLRLDNTDVPYSRKDVKLI